MYEKVLLWATPAFLILMLLECAVARARRVSPYRLADAVSSVSLGMLSTYLGVFTRLLSFGVYVLVFHVARVTTLDAASPWVWIAALLLYDFLYYWNHRLGHEVAILWAAHVVHHQSEEFNLSTALRQTGTGFLLSWIFYLPMALLGVPPEVFLFVSLIDLLYQFWIHTEQIGTLGVVDSILASPSNHRVHHAVNDVYLDRNYGGILILWDRIFGTFQPELAGVPPVYGTRDPLRSWNPLWANLHTYVTLVRTASRCHSWRDRLLVFWKHPGWRPLDPSDRASNATFRLPVEKFSPTLPRALGVYALVQGCVVLAFGVHFLTVQPSLAFGPALAYLAALAASLWIVGGLTEARRGYVWLEAARLAAAAAAFVVAATRPVAWSVSSAAALGAVAAAVVFAAWLAVAARPLPQTVSVGGRIAHG